MNREQIIETMARGIAHADGSKIAAPGQSKSTLEFGWFPDGEHFDLYTEAHWRKFITAASFALSVLEAAGLVVVPVEPSSAMIRDGVSYRLSTKIGGDNRWPEDTAALYTAMIKAALDPDRDSSG